MSAILEKDEELGEMEMVFDRKAAVMEQCLVLDPEIHEVMLDCDWLLALKRRTKDRSLFIYRNRIDDRFCLAQWMWNPKDDVARVCSEVEPLSHWPGFKAPPELTGDYLKIRLSGIGEEKQRLRKRAKDIVERRRSEALEKSMIKRDRVNELRRRGLEDLARVTESRDVRSLEQ